jgi:hypothetical protein
VNSGFVYNYTIARASTRALERNESYLSFSLVVLIGQILLMVISNILLCIHLIMALKNQLWRIKGMLGMIPLNII